MSDRVFDPGLQPERTLLAWRRTCLAFGVASIVAVRFAAEALGAGVIVVGAVGLLAAAAAYLLAGRRYRRMHAQLTGSGALTTDGWPLALAALSSVAVGLLALAYVLARGAAG